MLPPVVLTSSRASEVPQSPREDEESAVKRLRSYPSCTRLVGDDEDMCHLTPCERAVADPTAYGNLPTGRSVPGRSIAGIHYIRISPESSLRPASRSEEVNRRFKRQRFAAGYVPFRAASSCWRAERIIAASSSGDGGAAAAGASGAAAGPSQSASR